ncbi:MULTISPECIES: KAP family P-loop NTPase fold protein [Pectobacterium]|uniref:KAP family P-loop NTPase fold protein n=1 Tax=Pectobacterium TaxID=122277 RepID=UPI0018DA9046|nr:MULTISPECIES: P-loop NTPase fold protein [Pectobacterium]QPI44564.1 hypothetical protein I2D83_08335 [Pectobacterium aroidearum]
MRLTINELDYTKGFSSENDIFKRKGFSQKLEEIILASEDDGLVFALDDKWGTGKTTFIKMWQGENDKNESSKIKMVYFNAFENDYQNEPFISLAAKFYEIIDDKSELKPKLLEISKKIGKTLLSVGTKAGIAIATAGILKGSDVEDATDKISESISDPIEKLIEDKFKSINNESAVIKSFTETLRKISEEEGKKIVLFIDELDRARPDFSLELIEKVKHFFSVKNVVFILSMNRRQFEKGIQKRYGDIDTGLYLSKFVHYWFSLPKNNDGYNSLIRNYIDNVSPVIFNNVSNKNSIIWWISDLLTAQNASFRDAERCLSIISILLWKYDDMQYEDYFHFSVSTAAVLKVMTPEVVDKINDITYKEIYNALKIDKIDDQNRPSYEKYLKLEFLSDNELHGYSQNTHDPLIRRSALIKRAIGYIDNLSPH